MNDNAPIFTTTHDHYAMSVQENTQYHTFIGMVHAEDLDGDILTYSLTGDSAGELIKRLS